MFAAVLGPSSVSVDFNDRSAWRQRVCVSLFNAPYAFPAVWLFYLNFKNAEMYF